jgi:cytochrome b involved in lipid metabolism
MRFYWIRDRIKQGQFIIHWRAGKDNLADYFTKHHSPAHHKLMRSRYLLELHKPKT